VLPPVLPEPAVAVTYRDVAYPGCQRSNVDSAPATAGPIDADSGRTSVAVPQRVGKPCHGKEDQRPSVVIYACGIQVSAFAVTSL
jgi:hypothetical protein